jgi:3-deoxy-manno-octulosonate cytidylyltransferase (CMP-KDO synthetase)
VQKNEFTMSQELKTQKAMTTQESEINLSFSVVIPARYPSTRLPGKPLVDIAGKPMIQHVYERAQQSAATSVIVATDDQRIYDAVLGFGGEVCMTSEDHVSGTDRIHEVVTQRQLADGAIVVNVQGDEPLIPPAVINQVAANLHHHRDAAAATLSEKISSNRDFQNPNVVKVVSDNQGYAMCFSRAAIPFVRDGDEQLFSLDHTSSRHDFPQRHIGIYAYRVKLLKQFVQWPQAALETIEKLEQLRILSNGVKIHVSEAIEAVPGGIDTPDDLQRLRELLR